MFHTKFMWKITDVARQINYISTKYLLLSYLYIRFWDVQQPNAFIKASS